MVYIKRIKSYLKIMRIRHYLKIILIFLPLIFSGNLFNIDLLINNIKFFIIFCLLASAIYIINDIRDIEYDRLNTYKKNRPLARGDISIKKAIILVILLIISCILLLLIFKANIYIVLLLVIYFILNICYSLGLKNIPIIDIFILISGYIIRILYGAVVTDVMVSNWLYLTVLSFSTYLVLGKRKGEYINNKKKRKVLEYYSLNYLENNMYMFLGIGIVFYSLWTIDIKNNYYVFTVLIVMMIFLRYNLILEHDNEGDPINIILSDGYLIILGIIYVVSIFCLLYIF